MRQGKTEPLLTPAELADIARAEAAEELEAQLGGKEVNPADIKVVRADDGTTNLDYGDFFRKHRIRIRIPRSGRRG